MGKFNLIVQHPKPQKPVHGVLSMDKRGEAQFFTGNGDHILPYSKHPERRHDVDNGRVLCHACHVKTDTYGAKQLKGTRRDRNPYGPL